MYLSYLFLCALRDSHFHVKAVNLYILDKHWELRLVWINGVPQEIPIPCM